MKTTMLQCVSTLLMTAVLAGCGMIPTQNLGMRSAPPLPPATPSEEWAKVVALDRQSVSSGYMPKEVIGYDLTMAQMIPEGEAILASHDKTKAHIWAEKFGAVQAKRNKVIEKANALAMAKYNATPHPWANSKPDPCLSPMGKNICSTPAAQQGGVHYSAGPNGIQGNMGGLTIGPGGIGGILGGQ